MRHSFSLLFCAGAGVLLIVLTGLVVGFWDRQAPIALANVSGDPSALSGFAIGGAVTDGASWTEFSISGGNSYLGSKTYRTERTVPDSFYEDAPEPDTGMIPWASSSGKIIRRWAVGTDRLVLQLEAAGIPQLWLYDLEGNLLDQLRLPVPGIDREIRCSVLGSSILVTYQQRGSTAADRRLVDVGDKLSLSLAIDQETMAGIIHGAALLDGRLLLLTSAVEDDPVLDDEHPSGSVTYSQVTIRVFREQGGAPKLMYEGLLTCPNTDGIYRNFPYLWVQKEAAK